MGGSPFSDILRLKVYTGGLARQEDAALIDVRAGVGVATIILMWCLRLESWKRPMGNTEVCVWP